MDNQVNDLLMLTDQEIDFKGLPVEMLQQLALESEPYIANATGLTDAQKAALMALGAIETPA